MVKMIVPMQLATEVCMSGLNRAWNWHEVSCKQMVDINSVNIFCRLYHDRRRAANPGASIMSTAQVNCYIMPERFAWRGLFVGLE
jgi:hypothetical protein